MRKPDTTGVDLFRRVQTGWTMQHAFPVRDGLCACGCGEKLTGRRTRWATDRCAHEAYRAYSIIAGHSSAIRSAVLKRDGGVCASCDDVSTWEADHIVPVHLGGGGCDITGYQTLCIDCHRRKTAANARKRAERRREQPSLELEEVAHS